MKSFLLVFGWLVFCVLLAALIAPWLYMGVHELAAQHSSFQGIADYKFHRYFNRLVMIFAILGIVPLGRYLGYTSWQSLGFGGPHRLGRFWVGLLCSLIFIGALAVVIYLSGCSIIDPKMNSTYFVKAFVGVLLTGLAVGLLEEVFFRGFLFDIVRRESNVLGAIILVSLFYALLHFVKSPGDYTITEVHWNSMFQLLPNYFSSVHNFDRFFFGTLNLFMVGCILAWAYYRTGNLYLSIGLHAGYIIALKLNGKITDWAPGFPQWLLGWDGDLTTGPIAFLILLVQWLILRKLAKQLIVLGP